MVAKRFSGLFFCMMLGVTLLFAASCAKKQTAVSETSGTAVQKPAVSDDSAAREAERARMLELEKAQKMAREVQAFENEKIYFDFDKSDLKSESKVVLQNKAEFLRANSGYRLTIEGNCDERGTAEYNLALGERRANAAEAFLVTLGVAADRISTISYGKERPVDPGHNEAAWAKNRRDEFRLSK